MNDLEDVSGTRGRRSWLALAGGGGLLLRDVAGALGAHASARAPRARLALTSDASDALPSPIAE